MTRLTAPSRRGSHKDQTTRDRGTSDMATDRTDIVERLRDVSKEHFLPPSVQSMRNIRAQEACDDAADLIDRLRAEREELRIALARAVAALHAAKIVVADGMQVAAMEVLAKHKDTTR